MEDTEFNDLVEKWFDKTLKITFYTGVIIVILFVILLPLKQMVENGIAIHAMIQEYKNEQQTRIQEYEAREQQQDIAAEMILGVNWQCLEFNKTGCIKYILVKS